MVSCTQSCPVLKIATGYVLITVINTVELSEYVKSCMVALESEGTGGFACRPQLDTMSLDRKDLWNGIGNRLAES